MATPKLNTPTSGGTAPRMLRPTGAAPAKQLKLKGANGSTIAPKTTKKVAPKAAPRPADPAPEPAAVEPEVTPTPMEAVEAIETVDTEAAAQLTADEEAARLAQEEYERQMAEYNRQMEEYNRQMAELQAAEATQTEVQPQVDPTAQVDSESVAVEAAQAAAVAQALVTEEPHDAPTPTEKLRAAKSAKKKSNLTVTGAKKKKAAKSASLDDDDDGDMSDEEIAQREAYLRAIQEENQRTPIWKTVPFMVGTGLVVATIGICTYMVMQKQAENARIQAHIDYTNSLLRRAQDINMKGVENVADASKKGVDIKCTKADAKALLEVVVDPFVLGENGKPRYGARAEGVAQNACLLLGLAAEQDAEIREMIFDTMGKQCVKIKPTLFRWLLQRIAISDTEALNADLKKLAQVVADKKTAKPWNKKSQTLAYIWECIGLRVTASDAKEIIELLKSDIADSTLTPNLCICLDNILSMMDDADAKAKLGDEIFNNISDKLRKNTALACTLAKACSQAALEFYKKELETDKGWQGVAPTFIGVWGNDDILEFVLEKKEATKDNPKLQPVIENIIGTIMKQDRPRSIADAEKMLSMCFDNPFADTSGIQDIINKTDPESTLYIGDTHPDLPKLKEECKKLEALRKQKQQIIRVLACLCDHEWVTHLLDKYIADPDETVQYEAEKAKEKTQANAVNANKMREDYKRRNKQ